MDINHEKWNDIVEAMGPFVSEPLTTRLRECADEYELDFDALYDWASGIVCAHALLENVANGDADVISPNGEDDWNFRINSQGQAKTEELLAKLPGGAELVKEAQEQREQDDAVISADVIGDE
jgi:hypothetical protein